jgi:serine/threonine protein phosphatase 1
MGLIAIGDVHGCARSLKALLKQLDVQSDDHLVFVGDYIDRGPDSKGVIDHLLELRETVSCTFLRGNHEDLFLGWLDRDEYELFAINGGTTTLESYRDDSGTIVIPDEHTTFIRDTELWYETDDFVFVHAGLNPTMSVAQNLEEADPQVFMWERSHMKTDMLLWEKTVVCGHTPVSSPINRERLINIDTGCVFHSNASLGMLTAVRLPERNFEQVPFSG